MAQSAMEEAPPGIPAPEEKTTVGSASAGRASAIVAAGFSTSPVACCRRLRRRMKRRMRVLTASASARAEIREARMIAIQALKSPALLYGPHLGGGSGLYSGPSLSGTILERETHTRAQRERERERERDRVLQIKKKALDSSLI
ncbi:hypothetical protein HPP92_025169 [Vanilla planifolia]|uniref:Uncharacterized protein n=1 Tax=Vanilla planifolia TaxID=51239 RepID=A0A835UAC5_VANPL|nr:hypothetical protein HPP92_025169 [Vanilla planifolia]